MWSNEQGTDGFIPSEMVERLLPCDHHGTGPDELVDRGIWVRTSGGFSTAGDWESDFGQTTAAKIKKLLQRKKENQQAYRDRLKEETSQLKSVTGHVGEDRLGQERTGLPVWPDARKPGSPEAHQTKEEPF